MTESDPYEGLPASWSASAKTTYVEIEADNPNLDAAGSTALYEACGLLASADIMQARVDADGLLVTGSKNQLVAHPLIAEIRLARVQALAALKALSLTRAGGSAASRAGASLAGARWHKR